jgi:hypothetical protein
MEAPRLLLGAVAIGEEAIVPDAHEALGEPWRRNRRINSSTGRRITFLIEPPYTENASHSHASVLEVKDNSIYRYKGDLGGLKRDQAV